MKFSIFSRLFSLAFLAIAAIAQPVLAAYTFTREAVADYVADWRTFMVDPMSASPSNKERRQADELHSDMLKRRSVEAESMQQRSVESHQSPELSPSWRMCPSG